MATAFSMIPNEPMMDRRLSLRAKGVYTVITSFAGMPDFALSVSRLQRTCSDSVYAIRMALRELKACGYLTHSVCTDRNGAFCHSYTLYDCAQITPSPTPIFDTAGNRPNGDLHLIRSSCGNFTQVSSDLLRSADIPLQTKALYTMMKHLLGIPGFNFRIGALSSFCAEKSKSFRSAWSKLKLAGLLKQHRYPTGKRNRFEYTYDLLDAPDLDTPYFSNCRSDGSVSSCRTIREYLSAAHQKLRLVREAVVKRKPVVTEMPKGITFDYAAIQQERGQAFADLLRQAVEKIQCKKVYYADGKKLSRAERENAAGKLDSEKIMLFAKQIKISDEVRTPLSYLSVSLYRFLSDSERNHSDIYSAHPSLSIDDMIGVIQVIIKRVMHRKEMDIPPSPRDAELVRQYAELPTSPREDYESGLIRIFNEWKTV